MGRILEIKGADFSTNALDNLEGGYWLLGNDNIAASNTNLNPETTCWPSGEDVSALIRGKHVTKVKFKCGAAGVYSIKHTTKIKASGATVTTLASVTCTSSDVGNIVEKDVDFVFPNTGFLGCSNDVSGVLLYRYDTSISGAIVELNPIYNPVDGIITNSRYYNNDFFIAFD